MPKHGRPSGYLQQGVEDWLIGRRWVIEGEGMEDTEDYSIRQRRAEATQGKETGEEYQKEEACSF